MLPSTITSSIPVTVTVWAVFQLALVKVKVALSTVPSPVSPLVTSKTTSVRGSLSNTTVKVAVVPVSSVLPEMAEVVKEAVSSSSLVTATV